MTNHAKRARVVLYFALGSALLLVAGGSLALRSMHPQTVLPDGTVLTFEGVTYGTQHRHVTGAGLLPLLHAALPPELAKRVGVKEVTLTQTDLVNYAAPELSTVPRPFLVFWIRRIGPHNSLYQNSRGFTFDPARAGEPIGNARCIHKSRELEAWTVTAWSRRAAQVGFSREIHGRSPLSFIVPNPDQVIAAPPRVANAPVKVRDGDLEVTLRALTSGLRDLRIPMPARSGGLSVAHLEVQDHRGHTWEAGRFDLTDATGNWKPQPEGFAMARGGGHAMSLFHTDLRGNEPWTLRVGLTQTGGFRPEQLWNVGDIEVPPRSQVARLQPAARYRHSDYRLLGITGRNVGRAFGIDPPATSPSVYVQSPDRAAPLKLLKVTDQKGRPVKIQQADVRGTVRAFSLLPDPSVRSVSLTFALPEHRTVTLTARPTLGGNLEGLLSQNSH